jgi:hypothetical protein
MRDHRWQVVVCGALSGCAGGGGPVSAGLAQPLFQPAPQRLHGW